MTGARFPWLYGVRIVQVVFGVVVLALAAYVITFFPGSPETAFLLFNGIWTGFFSTPYLMVSPILAPKSLGHPFVLLVVEVITMLCWLAAFIAEAVVLPNSDDCIGPVCSGAEAAIVFAALDWALFVVTTGVAILAVLPSRNASKNADAAAPQQEQAPVEAQAQGANTEAEMHAV